MKNYDGPAFFRRRKFIESRSEKHKKTEQNNQRVQSINVPEKHVKPVLRRSRSVGDRQTPAFLEEIKNFVPKKRPQVDKRKKQIMTNYLTSQQHRRDHLYDRLTNKLRIKTADLIVLADRSGDDRDFHPQTAQNLPTQSKSQTSTTDSDVSKEMVMTEQIAKPVDNESVAQPVKTQSFENHSGESDRKQPFTSRLNHHGLGQSFKTIVNEESAGRKDLSLFSDSKLNPNQSTVTRKLDPNNNRVNNKPTSKQKPSSGELLKSQDNHSQSNKTNAVGSSDNSQADDRSYQFPPLSLLKKPDFHDDTSLDDWIEHQIDVLDRTFSAFKVNAQVVDWTNGPTVTQFQVKLALGVKVSRITNLNDDLKLALAAKDIRIEAPIPGKTTVGIEIPNPHPRPVVLSEIISTDKFKENHSPLTTAVGVDLSGTPQATDIRKMPHGLIAGATGSGKSVFINSLLVSLLYKATPADLKLLLIDPKAVELAPYDGIPHLLSPVISDPKGAAAALHWLTEEMDQRYEKLSAARVKNIEQFNQEAIKTKQYGLKMPYILVIIDELADLMMAASSEVEDYIVRITQKARAAGIHLIVATQRPSVDIVTGTIKNNIPSRIAFMVSSQVDSRTILDSAGAERLLGRGDMLYLGNGANQPKRLQGAFVTNNELEGVIDFVRQQGTPHYLFTPESLKKAEVNNQSQDRLMPQILKYIANEDTISTSKLQRVFSIGYNRAANIIDSLQKRQLVSEQNGSKPRQVYYNPDKEQDSEE
ncbi:DNA translocase FtsK [Lentilactobacillus diolivorans]|uniref:DNA translocase FtsK n=2 Tax=Lentilactobacillus diolivorans TaxID=179838 RepID=A0A0R1S6D5_9LACO|nr:DNA translocase FtsK [Lentilactobacillus diolivorans]KRL64573.1 cell division protein FtsK [Lentilactobacillus diolivorans DSM 14421]GEP22860.1 hypothetical protein LDI01_04530 [Lentilactobacillus diolivorans]